MNQALESTSLKQRDVVTTIVGITGSGKSTLLCRLFEEELPKRYSSTGVLGKQTFRGLLHHIAQIGSLKLSSHDQILEFLAPLLAAGVPEANVLSLAEIFTQEQVSEPTSSPPEDTVSPTQPQSSSVSPFPSAAATLSASKSPTTAAQIEKSHAKDNIAYYLRSSSASKQDAVLEILHVVDTGGQPEFMEVIPSLIHNSHIIALVVNLAQSFDDHSQMAFHEDGRKFKRPHPFVLTNRQMILQLIRTMQAKRSMNEDQQFKIIVIGTHRDKLWFKSKATIAAANMELKSIFLPAFKKELIAYRSDDEILFPLNSLKPNRDDKAILDEIRKKISDASLGEEIDIPPSFFMFEQDAIKYAKQHGREILSFGECVEVGSPLKMGQARILEALNYFHQHNIFLYFPDVLPDLIFTDPQAPLDFVNMVVAFSYKVIEGGFKGLPVEYAISLKNGIITEEMLLHDSLSQCFVPGIYQPQHAIELFTHLGVIAPMHEKETNHKKSQIKQQNQDSEQPTPKPSSNQMYLMPCLLQDLELAAIKRLLPRSSVAVFVVRFSNDCVPNGTFVGSLSRLLSAHGWMICHKEDGTPQCLAHNIVMLHDPKLPATITYVNATRHIELHVMCINADDFPSIFPQIRNTIFSAINTTIKIMRFVRITIEDAFLCNCDLSKSLSHAATLHRVGQMFFLQCTKVTGFKCPVNKTHEVWIQGQEGGDKGE